MNPLREARAFLRASLIHRTERDHRETPAQRRRRIIAVVVTLVLGTLALGASLAIEPGDPLFYPATLGVAVVWTVGSLASGKLHLGRAVTRSGQGSSRGIVQGVLLGGVLLGVFVLGALVVAQIPVLRAPVEDLLLHATRGSILVVAVITGVNGIAEELFFRGAVYAALPRRWNLWGSTVLYAVSTLLSGVLLLTFAALALGLLTGLQRRVTGGVAGPIASHLTWSLGMLFLLPPLLGV